MFPQNRGEGGNLKENEIYQTNCNRFCSPLLWGKRQAHSFVCHIMAVTAIHQHWVDWLEWLGPIFYCIWCIVKGTTINDLGGGPEKIKEKNSKALFQEKNILQEFFFIRPSQGKKGRGTLWVMLYKE